MPLATRIRAGRLRHRVDILAPSPAQDSFGGAPSDYAIVLPREPASIEALIGRELQGGEQITAQVLYQITIRYHSGVRSNQLVAFGSRLFQIQAPPNPDQTPHMLVLLCVERDDSTRDVINIVDSSALASTVSVAPASSGPFAVPHGLGYAPGAASIQMTSSGAIWWQPTKWDDTNLNLAASMGGVTADIALWRPPVAATVAAAPTSPGACTIAHGLGRAPRAASIQMTSSGAIWWQQPCKWTAAELRLVASEPGVTADIALWTSPPLAIIPVAPASSGPFAIAHRLGRAPEAASIQMTSSGAIWWQPSKWNSTDLLLVASMDGVTADIALW